jgi:EpsI family protein
MYSYGYLVPIISAVLAWSQRHTLRALPLRSALWPTLPWLAAWAVLVSSGHFSGIVLLEQLALLPGMAAIVVLVWGSAGLRALWPAVAYLLLMIPIWDAFTEPLHAPFQLMSATIGVALLQMLSVPVHQDGVFIYLPDLTIEVARACSGINYLIAVVALGLPLSYLQLRAPWRRVALVAAAVAVAILSNGLRVALIGLLAYLDVGSPLHGPAHVLHGLFVAAIGHATLLAGLWWLRGHESASTAAVPAVPAARSVPRSTVSRSTNPRPAMAGAVVAVAVFWGGASLVHGFNAIPRPLTGGLFLPLSVDTWVAAPYGPSPIDYWPHADAELAMRYRRPERTIDVHVAYYAVQAQDRELVNHLALGLHARARRVPVTGTPDPFAVNIARLGSDRGARLICFWYELQGQPEADATRVRLSTLWSAVRERRTSGAAVALITDLDEPGGEEAATDALLQVASRIRPILVEQFSTPAAPVAHAAARAPVRP